MHPSQSLGRVQPEKEAAASHACQTLHPTSTIFFTLGMRTLLSFIENNHIRMKSLFWQTISILFAFECFNMFCTDSELCLGWSSYVCLVSLSFLCQYLVCFPRIWVFSSVLCVFEAAGCGLSIQWLPSAGSVLTAVPHIWSPSPSPSPPPLQHKKSTKLRVSFDPQPTSAVSLSLFLT